MKPTDFPFGTAGFSFDSSEIDNVMTFLQESGRWFAFQKVNDNEWHVAVKMNFHEQFRAHMVMLGFLPKVSTLNDGLSL